MHSRVVTRQCSKKTTSTSTPPERSSLGAHQFFIFGWIFPEMTLLSREDGHVTTRSEAPNRIPCDSACFHPFPPVSVCFCLFPLNASRKLRGAPLNVSRKLRSAPFNASRKLRSAPQRSLPRWEWRSLDAALFCLHTWLPETDAEKEQICESILLQHWDMAPPQAKQQQKRDQCLAHVNSKTKGGSTQLCGTTNCT